MTRDLHAGPAVAPSCRNKKTLWQLDRLADNGIPAAHGKALLRVAPSSVYPDWRGSR